MRSQSERIAAEAHFLLERPHVRTGSPTEVNDLLRTVDRLAGRDDRLVELIRTSLEVRHLAVRSDPSETWRDCLSWIGPPLDDSRVVEGEYMRSEQRLGPSAPWRHYYPWLRDRQVAALPLMHNSAMASIATFFLSLKHATHGRPVTVLATRLYYETRQLLERMLPGSDVTLVECDDKDLMERLEAPRERPVVVWLDTAETADTLALFARVAALDASQRPLAIGWDNTLVPYWSDPLPDGSWPPVPVFLARSLHKLDELGLELASVGMLTAVVPASMSSGSAALVRALLDDLMIATKTLGTTAPPRDLRLLAALGLPDRRLIEDANRAARSATARFTGLLRSVLPDSMTMLQFPHQTFLTVRCHGQDETGTHALMAAIVEEAERAAVPVLRAASIGFSFTGMSVFTGQDPFEGDRAAFLRIAVGGHDDAVLDRVAQCFHTVLSAP